MATLSFLLSLSLSQLQEMPHEGQLLYKSHYIDLKTAGMFAETPEKMNMPITKIYKW